MAKLVPAQIEQLQEIGAYLRQLRHEQGRTIDDIANQIFIRPALLKAIEAGDQTHLPEPVFVQGFIRRYGDVLGVDGSALAANFSVAPVEAEPEPQPVAPHSNNGNHTHRTAGSVEPDIHHTVQSPPQTVAASTPSNGSKLPILWALLGVFALGVLIGLWSLFSQPRAQTVTESVETAPPASTDAGQNEAPEAPSDALSPTPSATDPNAEPASETDPNATAAANLAAPVVADLTVTDRSWVSIVADGTTVYEGTLESGTEETWTAQESIQMTAGNAGGVQVSFNGNDAITLGQSGNVRTIVLTPTTDPDSLGEPTE